MYVIGVPFITAVVVILFTWCAVRCDSVLPRDRRSMMNQWCAFVSGTVCIVPYELRFPIAVSDRVFSGAGISGVISIASCAWGWVAKTFGTVVFFTFEFNEVLASARAVPEIFFFWTEAGAFTDWFCISLKVPVLGNVGLVVPVRIFHYFVLTVSSLIKIFRVISSRNWSWRYENFYTNFKPMDYFHSKGFSFKLSTILDLRNGFCILHFYFLLFEIMSTIRNTNSSIRVGTFFVKVQCE